MKELQLTIIGIFDDEQAIRLAEDVKNALTSPDRSAVEGEVVDEFKTTARSPKITDVKIFDV